MAVFPESTSKIAARGPEVCLIQGIEVLMITLPVRRNKLAAGRTKDHADLESLPGESLPSETEHGK
jgi:hypothetical protein